jgi:hypothetical protein
MRDYVPPTVVDRMSANIDHHHGDEDEDFHFFVIGVLDKDFSTTGQQRVEELIHCFVPC